MGPCATGPALSSSTTVNWAKQGGIDTSQKSSSLKLCVAGRPEVSWLITDVCVCVCVCVCERERERERERDLHSRKQISPFHYLAACNGHQRVTIWTGKRNLREEGVSRLVRDRAREAGRNQEDQPTSSSKNMCHRKKESCPKLGK